MALSEPSGSGTRTVHDVAEGRAAFGLTSLFYFLQAQRERHDLPARFVAVVLNRSPLAAFVREDSDIEVPAQLAGRRVAVAGRFRWVADEYDGALRLANVGRPIRVPTDEAGSDLLGRGEVDVVTSWADIAPVIRRRAATAVRRIDVGPDVYTVGLVASDAVDDHLARRLTVAFGASLRLQRREPQLGIDAFHRAYPHLDAVDVAEAWTLLEPFVFDPHRPAGSMDAARWDETLDHVAFVHGIRTRPAAVYRTALLERADVTAATRS